MSFQLVSDSGCNLPLEIIERFGLHIVPTLFYSEDQDQKMRSTLSKDFDAADFYQRMRNGEVFKTSLISYADCERYIGPLLESCDDDLLYLVFSSGLTASFEMVSRYFADQRERYPGRRLEAIDSLSASLGMGLLVYQAAELRENGAGFEAVCDWVCANRLRICHWFTVSDLKYLVRGGRLSGASAAVATVLDIKPVMHVNNEGKLEPASKVRGRKKSLLALAEAFERSADAPQGEQQVFIAHGDCEADARFLADELRKRAGISEPLINYVDPVIGAHAGPGTIALFFTGEPR